MQRQTRSTKKSVAIIVESDEEAASVGEALVDPAATTDEVVILIQLALRINISDSPFEIIRQMNVDEDISAKASQSGSKPVKKQAPAKETARAVSCAYFLPVCPLLNPSIGQPDRRQEQEALQARSYRLFAVPRGQFPYPGFVYFPWNSFHSTVNHVSVPSHR